MNKQLFPHSCHELYPHKSSSYEEFKKNLHQGSPWVLIESESSGRGVTTFLQYCYQMIPSFGYQSLYVEAAPVVESGYAMSEKIISLFDTKAFAKDKKPVFHQAMELLRRYNFSPLYIVCDLSAAEKESAATLIQEAEFLWRHSPKNHLRFVFAKNWLYFSEKSSPSNSSSKDKERTSMWQVITLPEPQEADVALHIALTQKEFQRVSGETITIDDNVAAWMLEHYQSSFSQISWVLSHLLTTAHQKKMPHLSLSMVQELSKSMHAAAA